MVVAALPLDGFGDEARDVVGALGECGACLVERAVLRLGDVAAVAQIGRVDSGPVELREACGLHRVGVGERHRVSAPPVERLGQMQYRASEAGVESAGLVEAALPVERGLESVLDGERTAVDEEQVRQGRVPEDPGEGVDEPGHRHRVDVGVAGLVRCDSAELLCGTGVVRERRMVHAQCRGREEPEHVEVDGAVALVDQSYAARPFEVEDEVCSVREQVLPQDVVNAVGKQGSVTVRAPECSTHTGNDTSDNSVKGLHYRKFTGDYRHRS